MNRPRRLLVSVLLPLILAAAMPAVASPISTTTLTHLMIESEAVDADGLVLLFGPDFASHIVFSSLVDPLAMSYSYTSVPGSTYEGLSLTLSATGIFDPSTDTLAIASAGTLGADSWTSLGANLLAAGDTDKGNVDMFDGDGKKKSDVHIDSKENADGDCQRYEISD
jgi:hypothetical protein